MTPFRRFAPWKPAATRCEILNELTFPDGLPKNRDEVFEPPRSYAFMDSPSDQTAAPRRTMSFSKN